MPCSPVCPVRSPVCPVRSPVRPVSSPPRMPRTLGRPRFNLFYFTTSWAYINNNSVRDACISGKARNDTGKFFLERLLKLEMKLGLNMFYARVPSPSNISDGCSRNDLSELDRVTRADVTKLVTLCLRDVWCTEKWGKWNDVSPDCASGKRRSPSDALSWSLMFFTWSVSPLCLSMLSVMITH